MANATPTSIGFLGLGHMGASMAERLLAPDIRLYVFDTRQEAMEPFVKRGATACASPALVANSAEIIFASLPNPHVSEAVAAEIAGESACGSTRKCRRSATSPSSASRRFGRPMASPASTRRSAAVLTARVPGT